MYYTYMIRCEDNSIYTGMTNDLQRRFSEHALKKKQCAKYTLNHNAIRLEAAWASENRNLACKLEYNIKKLNKEKKEYLIENNDRIKEFLEDKIEHELYTKIDTKKYI